MRGADDRMFPTTLSRRLGLADSVPPPPESTISVATKSDSPRTQVNPKNDNTQSDPCAPNPDIASVLSRIPHPSLTKSVKGKSVSFSNALNGKISASSSGVRCLSASVPGARALESVLDGVDSGEEVV